MDSKILQKRSEVCYDLISDSYRDALLALYARSRKYGNVRRELLEMVFFSSFLFLAFLLTEECCSLGPVASRQNERICTEFSNWRVKSTVDCLTDRFMLVKKSFIPTGQL